MRRSLQAMVLRALAVVALAWPAAGCMRLDQDVTLNADGSFDLKVSFAYDEKAWAEFGKTLGAVVNGDDAQGDAEPGPKLDPLVKEKETRAKLEAAKAAGVEVRSFKVAKTPDGWLGETLDARCRDLAALNAALRALDMEEEFSLKRNADGSFTLASKGGESPLPLAQELGTEESAEELKKLKGFKAVSAITVPGEIVETNAHTREGRTARWAVDAADKDFPARVRAMIGKDDSVTFRADGFKPASREVHRYLREELELTFNADGSVDLVERKAMHEVFYKETEVRARANRGNADYLHRMFDEKVILDEFRQDQREGEKSGVELKAVKSEQVDGWHRVSTEMHCRDLAAAREAMGVRDYSLARSSEGTYRLTISAPDDAVRAVPELPAMKDMIRKMWELRRFYVTVRVPGDVTASTAHATSGRELKWSYDVNDLKFDEKLADMHRKGLVVSFKSEGLDLKEIPAAPKRGMTPVSGYRDGGVRKKPGPEKAQPEGEDSKPAPPPESPAPRP